MAARCKFYISDDHLGIMNNRTSDEEASFINAELKRLGVTVSIPFKYDSDGHCILGEISGLPGEECSAVFKYDFVGYRKNGSGVLVPFDWTV